MAPERDEHLLTTAEAARRLGIRRETVYAYVSRGLLTSVRATGRRGSLFAPEEVERLAERGRDGRPPSGSVERVRTALTLLEDDELYYRGRKATELATSQSVESVARLLWTGDLIDDSRLSAPVDLVDLARSAVAPLPASARLTDRLRVIVAALGAADPLRFDLSPGSVIRAAETIIGVMVDALATPPGRSLSSGTGLASRLWPALTAHPDGVARTDVLNALLVLLADHDLAASTVAARVAASTRAHPYAVVSAGLGAIDAQYHGAMSSLAYRFLAEAMSDPIAALGERLRAANGVPGFGHRVYQVRDPRAELILAMLRAEDTAGPVLEVVDAINGELRRGSGLPANVDLAMAATMHTFGMRPDAGEAIFAIARTIGWIAHALEEYSELGLRFRPQGIYTGVRPNRTGSAVR